MADAEPAPPSFWRAVGLTFEATARHARTCLVLVAVFAVLNGVSSAIGEAISVEVDPTRASPGELIAVSAAALAGFGTLLLVGVFIYPPTVGALSLVGSGAVTGDVVETKGIVARVLDRALETIGAFVLTALILLVGPVLVGIAGLVVGLAAGSEAAFAALLFTFLLVVVPMVYVFVRLSMAIPVAAREGLGPVTSLRRSWELVGGRWWWVLGVIVVVAIPANIISGVVAAVVSLGNAGGFWFDAGGRPNFVLAALGSTAGAAVSGSIFGVLTGVVYAALAQAKPTAELPLPDAAVEESPAPEAPREVSPEADVAPDSGSPPE